MKIREAKYSVSTIPYDLVFDKFATVNVVEDLSLRVSATEKISAVEDMAASFGSICDILAIYLEKSAVETIKMKDGNTFDKLAVTVCEESIGARFEVHFSGKAAHSAEQLLDNAALGDPLLLRGVVFESQSGGFKAVARKGGSLSLKAGVPEVFGPRELMCNRFFHFVF